MARFIKVSLWDREQEQEVILNADYIVKAYYQKQGQYSWPIIEYKCGDSIEVLKVNDPKNELFSKLLDDETVEVISPYGLHCKVEEID